MNAGLVEIHTLGCKLNQAESELLARQLSEAGYQVISEGKADIFILNTCTVTHIADRKARRWLRRMRRENPEALIVATGCYAERARKEIEQLSIADIIAGNKEKARLLELIQASKATLPVSDALKAACSESRVRAMVKIQDGCHDYCAYCIVPSVRSREYSLSPPEIVSEVRDRVSAGFREVVLTGTKIGCYQYGNISLRELIEAILKETNVERLRLSSLQPAEISPELLSLWEDHRLCRHFHLALQSGSEAVLKRMKRHYSVDEYRQAIGLIREMIPEVAISTDIMVGFPGETEAEFEETYRFCEKAGFARIHVFPYSPRPGTAAANMAHRIMEEVKTERANKTLELAYQSARKFQERFLERDLEVLWEKEVTTGSGLYSGLTENYIRVFTQVQEPLTNKILPVRLVGWHQQDVWGELIRIKERNRS